MYNTDFININQYLISPKIIKANLSNDLVKIIVITILELFSTRTVIISKHGRNYL